MQKKSILLFILSGFSFILIGIPIRLLGEDFPTLEKAFFRNLFGFICILVVIFVIQGPPKTFRSKRPWLQFLRAIFGVATMTFSFYAIDHAELSTVTAISFLRPILVTIAAILVFHEVVRLRRWIAMMIGFLGVFIITGFNHHLDFGTYSALLAVMFAAVVTICVKKLSSIDPPQLTVFWMGAIMSPVSFLILIIFSDWVWPTAYQWVLLFSMGVLATIAQLSLVFSMKHAELSLLLPYDFLKLIWATAIGFFLFSEAVNLNVIIGATLILGSTVYISLRERYLRQLEIKNKRLQHEKN